MDTANAGKLCRKLVVPSSGSTIQTRPEVTISGLNSSPTIGVPGMVRCRDSAMIASELRSTSVAQSALPLAFQAAGPGGEVTPLR